jgi:hypothetical protein
MSFDPKTLYDLLPAIYRIRDAEQAASGGQLLTAAEATQLALLEEVPNPTPNEQDRIRTLRLKAARGPLESLLSLFAEQLGIVEENLEQLYDDLFIETCAPWVIPYIGDLIGYQSLHGRAPKVASPRAEVAHTIAFRRRKGTAAMLEQVARDVTGWNARVVEFFERLATTQYMNHPRPHNLGCPDLRDGDALEWIGAAFESAARSVDVRRIESGRGRHNIPNVGVFLWRIDAHRHTDTPAVRAAPACYRVSPLNHDVPMYLRPRAETEIAHLADPENVPLALSRHYLSHHLERHYGEQVDGAPPTLVLSVGGTTVDKGKIDVCDLSGADGSWAHLPRPAGRYAIDPELGRIALPPEEPDPVNVNATWHEGLVAELGGGEYERGDNVATVRVPDDHPTIAAAIGAVSGSGVVVINDNRVYSEGLSIHVSGDSTVEIRAANHRRPMLLLSSPLTVTGEVGGRLILDGLLVAGDGIAVPDAGSNALRGVRVSHCTFVPGLELKPTGAPEHPDAPSLVVEIAGVEVEIERSIVGAIRSHDRCEIWAFDSIVDATDAEGVALAASSDGVSAGGRLHLEGCTVVGKIHAREIDTVTDSILVAVVAAGDTDWPAPVRTERRQVGCVRFSFLPFDSIVPSRYRCQPDSAEAARRIAPSFRSLRYGTPAYCQLTVSTPDAIRRGADDESEMGVYHHLYGPQRETNLRTRLKEYLRVGLQAGIFYES